MSILTLPAEPHWLNLPRFTSRIPTPIPTCRAASPSPSLVKVLARRAATAEERIGDIAGKPLPLAPEAAARLMDLDNIATAFWNRATWHFVRRPIPPPLRRFGRRLRRGLLLRSLRPPERPGPHLSGRRRGLQYKPKCIVTDGLRSYDAVKREVLPDMWHRTSRYLNYCAESFHRPTQRWSAPGSLDWQCETGPASCVGHGPETGSGPPSEAGHPASDGHVA